QVVDTMLLAQLLGASGGQAPSYRLADVTARTLGLTLAKALQTSDWSGPLSAAQLTYAARDAAVLVPLAEALEQACTDAGLSQVAAIDHRCLLALTWMELSGAPLDEDAWRALAQYEHRRTLSLDAELNAVLARTQATSCACAGEVSHAWEGILFP